MVTLACLFKGKTSAWVQGVKDRLKGGKSYLKTNFKIRVSEESQCADHCRVFALSDPEDHLCEHEHTKSCQSCDNIKNVLKGNRTEERPSLQVNDYLYHVLQSSPFKTKNLNFLAVKTKERRQISPLTDFVLFSLSLIVSFYTCKTISSQDITRRYIL